MNNKITFLDDNQNDSNMNLLKENTPQTVDYNQLYNIQQKKDNEKIQNFNPNDNLTNNNSGNMINSTKNLELTNKENKKEPTKKGINSLLFVFIIFIIIMIAIVFLFPYLGKFSLG